jgi:hypothetical protein
LPSPRWNRTQIGLLVPMVVGVRTGADDAPGPSNLLTFCSVPPAPQASDTPEPEEGSWAGLALACGVA